MPEIVLWLRVWDNSSSAKVDTNWHKVMGVEFLPTEADDLELWDRGPLAPVKRRWWRPDGRPVVTLAELIINAPQPGNATGDDGRLRWVPCSWRQGLDHPDALLRAAGWEARTDA